MVQWLRLRATTAGGKGSIPGQGTKIPHAKQCGQKEKKKKDHIGNIGMVHLLWKKTVAVPLTLKIELVTM